METGTKSCGRMLLSVRMLADELEEEYQDFFVSEDSLAPLLSGCMMYCGQRQLRKDLIYVLPETGAEGFPVDRFSYACAQSRAGTAAHICGINASSVQILNALLAIFQKYHDFEMELSNVVTGGGTIEDLLVVAEPIFGNPMYVHDNMFAVIALPHILEGMLKFEYNQKTGRIYIPLWLIEDFKFDEDYRSTLLRHDPGIWGTDEYPFHLRSLYVNLWDGSYYCGRLLINELRTLLKPGHAQTAMYLAEYIMMIIHRDAGHAMQSYHNFEETFIDLIDNREVPASDLSAVLEILGWREDDRYLCLRLRNQDPSLNIKTITVLRSAMASVLTGYSSFFYENDLCVVLDQSVSDNSYSEVRSLMAQHVRDSYLHCGISNSFTGIRNLSDGFAQAQIALQYIVTGNQMHWVVSFDECVLPHLQYYVTRQMRPEMLAAPDLLRLRAYDRENGTEYYKTLRAYLLNERNIPETSEALIIHRTTLSYRLKKMQELMTTNLDNPEERFYLLLSFRLLES